MVLHRAGCRTISGPSSGSTFTGEYSKVCETRDQLKNFAQTLGVLASPCGICPAQTFVCGEHGHLDVLGIQVVS
jgi:hypothetical protein